MCRGRVAVLLAALSTVVSTSEKAWAQCPPSFAPAVTYAVGSEPGAVATGDFQPRLR